MPVTTPRPNDTDGPFTQVDDEQYEEIAKLEGQKIVYAAVWEDALADALADLQDAESGQPGVDLDLYLRDNVYFELYGTLCYVSLDEEPLPSQAEVETRLTALIHDELWLQEVAVDDEEALVLVLGRDQRPLLYVQVGAWLLDEWEELPEGTVS